MVILSIGSQCHAQSNQDNGNNTYDFLPRAKVIFDDNFSHDKVGAFPSRWKSSTGEQSSQDSRYCHVQKDENDDFMLLTGNEATSIEPAGIGDAYLSDSFTMEFDFRFGAPAAALNVDFRIKHTGTRSFDWFLIKATGEITYFNINKAEKTSKDYPGIFDYSVWHHFALSNKGGHYNLYIDQYLILTESINYGYPMLSFGLHSTPPVKYKNFKVATGAEIHLPVATKTEKAAPAALKVFANADRMSFTVNVPATAKENALITVADIKGKKIKSVMATTNTDTEITLDAAPGIYLISAVTKTKTFSAKIALE